MLSNLTHDRDNQLDKQNDNTVISFVLRFSFYTVKSECESNFDTTKILESVIKTVRETQIGLVNHRILPVYGDDEAKIIRHKVWLDFRINITQEQIDSYKGKGSFLGITKKEPEEYFIEKYVSIINEILEEIQGIDYVVASCNPYEMIRCEGRVDKISR